MGLPQSKKMRIFTRDGFKCRYCGIDGSSNFDTWYYANFNVDHVNPNGDNDDSNLVTACRTCNLLKWKHPCENEVEAKALVDRKRIDSLEWFNKYVRKSSSVSDATPS